MKYHKIICPTVLADSKQDFDTQMERIAGFAQRIQIDITDGVFTPKKTIEISDVWFPKKMIIDFHVMYKHPGRYIDELLAYKPNLIIVHKEATVDVQAVSKRVHEAGSKLGVALLPTTDVNVLTPYVDDIDHILLFSGDLGHFGGTADLNLLTKARYIKKHWPHIEVGWDGGVNEKNIHALIESGVDVANVGGFIQNASQPAEQYKILRDKIT